MAKEIWKKVTNAEGYYVSNLGRVRGLKGTILRGGDNGVGYKKIELITPEGHKREYIHRMVAIHFVPNPDNKPCVNHIDCDPSNNAADNLEWCTKKENSEHMVKLGRNRRTKSWLYHLHLSQEKTYKPVIGTSIKTGEELYFRKLNAVKEKGFQPSCVCNAINGQRGITQHKGYKWRYA